MAGEITPSKSKTIEPSKDKIEALGEEIGTDIVLPFSTPYQPVGDGTKKNPSEELHEVLNYEDGETGPSVRQLTVMRKMDGQARALYRLLTLPIRAALNTATFVPAEDGEEEADFIDAVFHTPPESGGMTVTFHRFMSQLLMGLFDGFSAFEKVFWKPGYGPLKNKYTLQKLGHRPSTSISFVTAKDGSFRGFRQRAFVHGREIDEYIPKQYAFYYAAQEEERKFYGVSFFESAFYHYDKKVKLYYTAHVAAQRNAVGTRVGTVPNNATEAAKREFAGALGNLALAQWMMMPEGFKVDKLMEGGSFDFLAMINHHNSAMSKSILAAFFDQDQGRSGAETPLINNSQPGDDMFVLMLRAIMDDIANQINHYIIPQLIDLNFKGGRYPKFVWGKLTDEQRAAIRSTFDKLANANTVTPEFMRAIEETVAEEFGLELDYDEIDMREEAELQAQNAANGFGDPAAAGGDAEIAAAEGGAEGAQPPAAAGAASSTPPPAVPGQPTPPASSSAPGPTEGAPQPDAQSEEAPQGPRLVGDWTLEDFISAIVVEDDEDDEQDEPGTASLTGMTPDLIQLANTIINSALEDSRGA